MSLKAITSLVELLVCRKVCKTGVCRRIRGFLARNGIFPETSILRHIYPRATTLA